MTTLSLTADHISKLRHNAGTSHQRRIFTGPVQWVTWRGGPLDGVRSAIEAAALKNQYIGWCTVHDRFGPVTALYTRTENPDIWVFHELSMGVQ